MRYLYLAAFLAIVGCSMPETKVKGGGDSTTSLPWKESMIHGASFSSIPDSGIVDLVFPEAGNTVAATIGDRNDALASPLWYWSIDSSGALVLSDAFGKREATIELIDFKNHEVVVRVDKSVIHYKRTQR